jgi:hypothetical protein
MTLVELFERAMAGHKREVQCWYLLMSFSPDMPVGDMMDLERLVTELDLDPASFEEIGDDMATWTPKMMEDS